MYCSCISDEIKPDGSTEPIPLQADFQISFPSLRLDATSWQENLKAFKPYSKSAVSIVSIFHIYAKCLFCIRFFPILVNFYPADFATKHIFVDFQYFLTFFFRYLGIASLLGIARSFIFWNLCNFYFVFSRQIHRDLKQF